tara:strand:- start:534 stop:1934 length:1401 start_codon:yes stop_codon:yes gene_type:complete
MNVQLCWFRNDLRIGDNTALWQALKQGSTLAIYIATPEQWRLHDDAPIKIDFWRRNLQQLQLQLENLNIPLLFFQVPYYRDIPALMQEIISSWNIAALHCNTEYPLNEVKRDDAIEHICREMGVKFFAYEDQCLLAPDLTLKADGQPFKVFTPFANKARTLLLSPASRQKNRNLSITNSEQFMNKLHRLTKQVRLDDIEWPQAESWWQKLWPAGESEAARRLRHFLNRKVKDYKQHRDIPSVEGTSALSAYLNSGIISVKTCWDKTDSLKAIDAVHTWRTELLWRDFYKYVMHHYPHVSKNQAWNSRYKDIPWRQDHTDFQAWANGETGFPLIDAAMRQLKQTGWMHNRLRMLVAMFLSKNLLIDWRWGERWFMQHLIDGDFSANNGGWQWSASTGTDAAPYFRIFNPIRQSERFDPDGVFIKSYIPELKAETAKTIHDPGKLRSDYVKPIIDLRFSRERALAVFR